MYTVSITIDNVIDKLADFLQPFCDGAEIVRAQANRVPMPVSPCVVLTELLQVELETPIITNDGVNNQASSKGPKRIDVQVDFYGPNAGDQCAAIKSIWRTTYCAGQFPAYIQPLYCGDGIQAPLITGEEQWQSRWMLTVSIQYNPIVTVPQQFADSVSVGSVIQIDAVSDGVIT